MTNVASSFALEDFGNGDLDWAVHTFKVVLIDATYVYSAAHNFLDDVAAGARVFTHTLTGKTNVGGVLSAATEVVTIPAGDQITQAWLYRDSGAEATSRLVAYYDQDATGQPFAFTPDGSPVRLEIPLNLLTI